MVIKNSLNLHNQIMSLSSLVVQATLMTKHIPESGEARYCDVYENIFEVLNDHCKEMHLSIKSGHLISVHNN